MAFANVRNKAWLGALGVACGLVLTGCATTRTPDVATTAALDRQVILDQITRYYYNFGKSGDKPAEESFYTEDGVLILGDTKYEGREGVKRAYNRAPPPAAAAGAAAAAPAAPRERTAFNVVVSNPLIIVHGDTATSQVIFTEYRQDKKGDPMKMTTQGKEYAIWAKVNGKWLYKKRQIASGSEPPADWKE
jgi:hypothetical protein